MSLKSLNRVFSYLQALPGWEERQRFQEVLECWSVQMEPALKAQTRPISLVKGVLRVATSSAVWVAELNFQRSQILERLNLHLSSPVQEIRFSTAQWSVPQDASLCSGSPASELLWQEHPSRLREKTSVCLNTSNSPQDPLDAFANWTQAVKSRSRNFPLCPTCQCPTPPGELQRWSVCAHCAARQWQL